VSRKQKLLARLLQRSADLTWDEAVTIMTSHGFKLLKSSGSARRFVHTKSRTKVFIHEPHPEKVVKVYAQDALIDGLRNAGELT
jgi:predicted RNA binding protein YcfA (HicA-like mRNA interferase family)